MHGCENRRRLRRMLSVPTRGVISAVDDSDVANGGSCSAAASSFVKDVRKINIGDCALFEPPQESPPFIGIIRSFESDKDNNLHLGVNWLYRPADVQLVKGVAVEAAPNEVFYSFHRDEIPAASLLHPCKVAFLPKGVELPSGVSSFVCRRVYDIANKRLWWLTDKDFINDRQEEVDQLLHRTQFDMHASVQQQQGGRSPKPVSSPMSASQLKHSPDRVQNSATAFGSQVKGKKRERSDQGSEPIKRERSSKLDDGDSSLMRLESFLKSEIAKLTEKGGLVNCEAVEKFVHLLQPDNSERKIDLACRCLLVGVIAATDRDDCLSRFVQLKGLPVLDEWLQEVHKGKVGDSSSPRDRDRSVEDFLLILLRALDKLPVNLNALQMCNIGKSVNHLRSHRNSDIQKKARSLVDTWKKRVEAEMNINDTRSSTNQTVPWPGRMRNEVSHGGSRHTSVSDTGAKHPPSQLSSAKSAPVKLIQGEVVTKSVSTSASPAIVKLPSSPASTSANLREGHVRTPAISGSSELLLSAAKDDKSSSSSQSHTNSQCSSVQAKNLGVSVKEDARSSNSGSTSFNRGSGSASRHRKTANGLQGVATSSVQRDVGLSKNSALTKISASEKLQQPPVCEKSTDAPASDNNNHKLIVKISNRVRSPAQNVNGGSVEDPSSTNSRTSSPVVPEKHGQSERSSKEKTDGQRNSPASDMNPESSQGNSSKDGATACEEGGASPSATADGRICQSLDEAGKLVSTAKVVTASRSELKSRNMHDSSLNSINALIESCVKYSEVNVPMSAGDEVGMNLLASVAAGEIKSAAASPAQSPQSQRCTSGTDASCRDCNEKSKPNGDIDVSHGESNQSAVADAASEKQNVLSDICKEEQADRPRRGDNGTLPKSDSSLRSDENLVESVPTRTNEVAEQGHESKPASESSFVSTRNRSQAVAMSLAEDKKSDAPLKEENELKSSDAGSVPSADNGNRNNSVIKRHASKMEKFAPAVSSLQLVSRNEKGVVASCINNLLPGQFSDVKEDDDLGVGKLVNQGANKMLKQEKDEQQVRQIQEETVSKSAGLKENAKASEIISCNKDLPVDSVSQIRSPASPGPVKEPISGSNDSKLAVVDSENADVDRPSTATTASSPVAESSGMDGKREFDLNEGFDVDDNKDGDLSSMSTPGSLSAVRLVSPLPSFSVASTSASLPASITVAAAAKGPFVPPEDLLRNKGEVGWRGSAATSAFRPAEPRKVPDMPSTANTQASDAPSGRQGRVRFEIDLNVADDMEDMGYQSNDVEISRNNEYINNGPSSVASGRYAGGLDLDLNKIDDAPEVGQPLLNNHRFDMPVQPVKIASTLSNSDSTRRDFDLNDGPAADETAVESSSFNHHGRVNIPPQPSAGFRMNNAEMGNLNPWYPAVSTFSAIPIPAPLPDRDQPFPIVGSGGGPPRILTGPAGIMQFSPDMYRGSVLSSSPAVPFTATPFQYPVFPFGTSFPLPSSSLPGGSAAFMDLSSGGRLCIPAVPSQLVGSAPNVSSQFPRPYVVSLSDVSNSVSADNARKWGRQGLDLNAGPGAPDLEGRDETAPMPPRQMTMGSFALTDEQSRMYSMAGGVLKRKEPEGGWESERLNYKHPSWQ